MSDNLEGHPIAEHVLNNDAMLAELDELRSMKSLGLRMRAQNLGVDMKQFSGVTPRVPMIVAIFEKRFQTNPFTEGPSNGEAAPPPEKAPDPTPAPAKAQPEPAKITPAKRTKKSSKAPAEKKAKDSTPAPAKKVAKSNGKPMTPKGPSSYMTDDEESEEAKPKAAPKPAKRPSKVPAKAKAKEQKRAPAPSTPATPPPEPASMAPVGSIEEYLAQSFGMTMARLDELTAHTQQTGKAVEGNALYDQVETMRDQVTQLQSQMVQLQEMMMALAPTLSMIYDSVQAGIHCLAKDMGPGRAKAVRQLFSKINTDYSDNGESNNGGKEPT